MNVKFTGSTEGYHSISVINKYIISMIQNSEHFRLVETEPYDIEIRHTYPPIWNPTNAKTLIYMLEWEFERVPFEWVIQLNQIASAIIVPSEHLKKIYENAGVSTKIYVIPHGVDKKYYFPKVVKKDKVYRFLYIGSYQYRKGADLLLDVWNTHFKDDPNYELVFKDMTHVYGKKELNVSANNIQYIPGIYTSDQMANLYKSCDCYVTTSRGESFCLPLIEAAACGLEVIAPFTKPFTEVLPSAHFVSVKKQVINPYEKFIGKVGDAFSNMGSHFCVYEINKDDLAKKMKMKMKSVKDKEIKSWYEVLLIYESLIKKIAETI